MKFLYLALCLLILPVTAHATESDVRSFADSLAQEALTIVKNEELSKTGKQRRLEDLFTTRVDVEWVARFVLGKYWRTASEEQQKAYLDNYRRFVVSHYSDRLTDYNEQQYTIKSVRAENDKEYVVSMEIINPGEANVLLDYRVRDTDTGYKIYDIIVEGVSMITTQRSEFDSVISRNGLDYLIDALAKKAKAA
jgi:phospholipid transport system substrate-binding protein